MSYIWQHPLWPHLALNVDQIAPLEALFLDKLSRLQGKVNVFPIGERAYFDLGQMVDEAVANAAIEGERVAPEDVRSSIIIQLGLDETLPLVKDQRARGMAMLQILNREEWALPLTISMMHEWQRLSLRGTEQRYLATPITLGKFRTHPVQVVSGPIGREKIHYEAPPPNQVEGHMEQLLTWFNGRPLEQGSHLSTNAIARASIAHLWFESIHPYDDGNGRVGRTLAEKALMQSVGGPLLFSLSSMLANRREAYYQALANASAAADYRTLDYGIDCTDWVLWFGQQILLALDDAEQTIGFVMAKAQFWQAHSSTELNARQQKVLTRLFAAGVRGFTGGLNAAKYMRLTKCSKATATRDLADLREKGCLSAAGSGRSVSYHLALPAATDQ